jgi:non-heme chloroperoxidase
MHRTWITAFGLFLASTAHAATTPATAPASISGTWQGTLTVGPQSLRVVFKIRRDERGEWQAMHYSIDQSPSPIPVSAVTLNGATVKLTVERIGGIYEGTLSSDGQSIEGTWKQARTVPLVLHRATKRTAWELDSSPHTVSLVTVDHDVKLEVLDWGGTGRPLVLLTGLGNDAHVYDKFAPKLTGSYHVVGITRRGFGNSSAPATGYSAYRLGDDVLEVLEALKISRPVLVGHSIAGEELSSIGSRHPEKVAGLIYLDAGYAYAFYNESRGNLMVDSDEVRAQLDALQDALQKGDIGVGITQELLTTDLPRLTKALKELQEQAHSASSAAAPAATPSAVDGVWLGPGLESSRVQITVRSDASGHELCTFDSVDQGTFGLPCANVVFQAPDFFFEVPSVEGKYAGKLVADSQSLSGTYTGGGVTVPLNLTRQATAIAPPPPPPTPAPTRAIFAGARRFPAINAVPILAIFADPHGPTGDNDPETETQVKAFEHAMPAAHVVRLAHANHYVFISNEADVLREMNAFIAGLPAMDASN